MRLVSTQNTCFCGEIRKKNVIKRPIRIYMYGGEINILYRCVNIMSVNVRTEKKNKIK